MTHRGREISRRKSLAQLFALLMSPIRGRSFSAGPALESFGRSGPAWPRGSPSRPKITFRNVAQEAGITPALVCGTPEKKYILEVNGTGCVWFDYNNDGYADLYIVNGSTMANLLNPGRSEKPRNYLFRNNGDGTFTDVTERAGLPGAGWGNGALAADFDNDGNVDLLVTNFGPNILYKNNGDGTFTDVTAKAGLGEEMSGQRAPPSATMITTVIWTSTSAGTSTSISTILPTPASFTAPIAANRSWLAVHAGSKGHRTSFITITAMARSLMSPTVRG